tara:strand:- start:376 stop:726 length:351 start_codon:yes stop_codon:yes gene_type:complete
MFTNRYKNKNLNKNVPPPRPIIKYNPAPKKKSILSTIGESFTWGIGMGAGSEMGHSVFRGIFGEKNEPTINNSQDKSLSPNEKCDLLIKSLEKCYNSSTNQEKCHELLEQMKKSCA